MLPVKLINWAAWWVNCDPNYGEGQNPLEYGERNSFRNEKTDRHILMQFTGLLDRKGKEIYEEDWVDTPDGIHSVKWGGDGWEFGEYIRSESKATNGCLLQWGTLVLEVLGNKWENPELLKEG